MKKKRMYQLLADYAPKISHDCTYEELVNLEHFRHWEIYRKHFSFSVPDKKSIEKITKFIGKDKVLEIGAGKGFHAYLLSLEGVDIVATDNYSWPAPTYGPNFMEIKKIDYKDALEKYKDRNVLMMIWPPLEGSVGGDMSHTALQNFKGNKIIYIGEEEDGATGTKKFFKMLKKDWKLVEQVNIPQFWGIHDYAFLYKRKKS